MCLYISWGRISTPESEASRMRRASLGFMDTDRQLLTLKLAEPPHAH
jgi:hypothetical protein